MTAAEREILKAIKELTTRVEALHAAFDELTLSPAEEPQDVSTQHTSFVERARRSYEAHGAKHG